MGINNKWCSHKPTNYSNVFKQFNDAIIRCECLLFVMNFSFKVLNIVSLQMIVKDLINWFKTSKSFETEFFRFSTIKDLFWTHSFLFLKQ
ncbi:hypothetical protein CDAR_478291 [Caerostris darwini]|uniref:Uncharacterized protein n=1 Tax=Caerostris darwini TaxID=1538125 RepID=A0AAV4VGL6_9ARAC|nr:hypothetical protein CDAR_478291 [Caerostris darwini]